MYSLPQSYNQTSKCKRCISSNAYLEPGEFIGSATRANVKEFKAKFKMFEMEEEELPVHEFVTPEQVTENYDRIIQEVQAILNGDI